MYKQFALMACMASSLLFAVGQSGIGRTHVAEVVSASGLVMNTVLAQCEKRVNKKYKTPVGIATTACYKAALDCLASHNKGGAISWKLPLKSLLFRSAEEGFYRACCAGAHAWDAPKFIKNVCPKDRLSRAKFLTVQRFLQFCTESLIKAPLHFIKPNDLRDDGLFGVAINISNDRRKAWVTKYHFPSRAAKAVDYNLARVRHDGPGRVVVDGREVNLENVAADDPNVQVIQNVNNKTTYIRGNNVHISNIGNVIVEDNRVYIGPLKLLAMLVRFWIC